MDKKKEEEEGKMAKIGIFMLDFLDLHVVKD